jgi:cyanophycinase
MTPVYLIGGGWKTETFGETYGRFLKNAVNNGQRRIVIIVAEEDGADSHAQFLRFRGAFESAGLNSADAFEIIVSAENPLTIEKLIEVQPTGVFVCGGLTPAYFDAICMEKSWLDYLFENNIPYCGFSAGASVAAENAIVGGWRREINNKIIEIADENAGEDLDLLDVREGLGLVPFSVDVHATQWGTLSRLVHAVDAKFTDVGWAIDENTLLESDGNNVRIFGMGNAYRIKRQNGETIIDVFQAEQ